MLNADEMATGEKAIYLLTSTLTSNTDLSVYINLPYESISLFTVSSVEVISCGPNLVMQEPLPKPVLKAVTSNAGNNQAVWSLGEIQRGKEVPALPTDDDLVIRATIQAQEHLKMTPDSIHWLNFAAECNRSSQYMVQKPVTVREGGKKFVKVDLQLNSTFQGIYTAG